ncbi:MAG: hypothetical protein ACFCVE_05915 [Phycisphaerae bacterium]
MAATETAQTPGPRLAEWLHRHEVPAWLSPHVAAVVLAMPSAARDDLLDDDDFRLTEYDPTQASTVPISAPSRRGPARAVALKRTLRSRPPAFVQWVVAHELAHVYLRNGGRTPGEDPELAADALAEAWGFPRPAR